MIEAGVEDKRFPRRVADGPEISYRIASKKRLCEVPDFARESEVFEERVRNGQRLPKLCAPHRLLHQLRKEGVRVVAKALDVRARQKQKRVARASEVEFRSSAVVNAMRVADCKCGLGAFSLMAAEPVAQFTAEGTTTNRVADVFLGAQGVLYLQVCRDAWQNGFADSIRCID